MILRIAGQAYLADFYFDFRDEDEQNVRDLLTSLLIQLSAYSSPLSQHHLPLYLEYGNGTQQPNDDALTNCQLLPEEGSCGGGRTPNLHHHRRTR